MRRKLLAMIVIGVAVFGTVIVWASPQQQANAYELFLLEARQDLERLGNESLGDGVRPANWTFNFEPGSETMLVDLWFDNELLAEEVFGAGVRPDGWFGATTTDPLLLSRNVRHDLELTADSIYGQRERPEDWNGAPPIYRCDRTLQNTVRLIEELYQRVPTTSDNTFDYCDALTTETIGTLLPPVFETETLPDEGAGLQALTLAVRGDLERLANELLGVNTRPGAWVGNVDEQSLTLALDINTDLELLAGLSLGDDRRPDGWTRFISDSPALSYRTLRYNLELLSDATLGAGIRPNGWQGQNPLITCDIVTQGLVFIVERRYGFVVDETLGESPDFCRAIGFTANGFSENPPPPPDDDPIEDPNDAFFTAESRNAFSYLDVGTTQYMGIMPWGTEFRAWYRNYQESTMMFVTGEGFGLYIDRRWTTMDPDVFARLPNLDGVRPLTFCDANWCNGPGPTPTPTGNALLAVQLGGDATPRPPGPVDAPGDQTGKTQVSWNNIRVTYLLDRLDAGVAQVTLEICAEPQQITCEPVTSVFDNNLGVPEAVVSQFNGLNVYELPYGYSSTFTIEGPTLISPDVWISDPTIR